MARPRSEHPKAPKSYLLPVGLVDQYSHLAIDVGLGANVLVQRAMEAFLPTLEAGAGRIRSADVRIAG